MPCVWRRTPLPVGSLVPRDFAVHPVGNLLRAVLFGRSDRRSFRHDDDVYAYTFEVNSGVDFPSIAETFVRAGTSLRSTILTESETGAVVVVCSRWVMQATCLVGESYLRSGTCVEAAPFAVTSVLADAKSSSSSLLCGPYPLALWQFSALVSSRRELQEASVVSRETLARRGVHRSVSDAILYSEPPPTSDCYFQPVFSDPSAGSRLLASFVDAERSAMCPDRKAVCLSRDSYPKPIVPVDIVYAIDPLTGFRFTNTNSFVVIVSGHELSGDETSTPRSSAETELFAHAPDRFK